MFKTINNYFKGAMLLLVFSLYSYSSFAQDKPAEQKPAAPDWSLGSTAFMQYSSESNPNGLSNTQFNVTRAYLTLKKSLFSFLDFRVTGDIFTEYKDSTGNGGGTKYRLKYAYADFKLGDLSFLTKSDIEFGLVHTSWLDWEEGLNRYRMEGTMFLERSGLLSSADFGATFTSLFGGQLSDEYKNTVSKKYPGKYGSLQIGVYNGGGYSYVYDIYSTSGSKLFTDNNPNKVFQGRLSLRPLSDVSGLEGLQLTYLNITGEGAKNFSFNVGPSKYDTTFAYNPAWQVNNIMLSYEHKDFVISGQYTMGKGNLAGTSNYTTSKITPITGDTVHFDTLKTITATEFNGFSVYGELKMFNPIKIMLRYDSFVADKDDSHLKSASAGKFGDTKTSNRYIVGVAYDFGKNNMLLLNLDKVSFRDKDGKISKSDDNFVYLTMQIDF